MGVLLSKQLLTNNIHYSLACGFCAMIAKNETWGPNCTQHHSHASWIGIKETFIEGMNSKTHDPHKPGLSYCTGSEIAHKIGPWVLSWTIELLLDEMIGNFLVAPECEREISVHTVNRMLFRAITDNTFKNTIDVRTFIETFVRCCHIWGTKAT